MIPDERMMFLELAEEIVLNLRGRLCGNDTSSFGGPVPGAVSPEVLTRMGHVCLSVDEEKPR